MQTCSQRRVSVTTRTGIKPTLLLDNQAKIHIVRPNLVTNIRCGDCDIPVFGIGKTPIVVNKLGTLGVLGEVYVSDEIPTSILSYANIEDNFPISYNQEARSFVVVTPAGDLT